MPNRNYVNGVAYERKLQHLLQTQGLTVIRAAGSHGPWDLIAMPKEPPMTPVRCFQVKRVKTHTALRKLLNDFQPEWTLEDYITGKTTYITELWVWMDREGWHIKDYRGPYQPGA